jgi:hypothetical protein
LSFLLSNILIQLSKKNILPCFESLLASVYFFLSKTFHFEPSPKMKCKVLTSTSFHAGVRGYVIKKHSFNGILNGILVITDSLFVVLHFPVVSYQLLSVCKGVRS